MLMNQGSTGVNVEMLRNKDCHYSRSLIVLDVLLVSDPMFYNINIMILNILILKKIM